ncbi:MAG TPA: MetS family NSS transporter small subunit [Acidobacteriota bacterium]|nr:MetS family NSS transporter small subunit [Acidobacteriota bacterium]
MSTISLLTMIVILSVLWGGFTLCLVVALRKERRKDDS